MAKMRLRRFLYLDGDLTDEFLAQAEGGLYSEEDQSTTATSEKSGKVGLSAGPAAAEVGAGKGGQESRARKMRRPRRAASAALPHCSRAQKAFSGSIRSMRASGNNLSAARC